MSANVLFVTGRHQSLGETYSLAGFAEELRRAGWGVHFLAFEFAAEFLRRQELPLSLLGEDLDANRRAFQAAVRAGPPELVVTTDFFLLALKETAAVWSNRWLFELACPLASFDHLGFHPQRRELHLGFHRRLAAMPASFVRAHPRVVSVDPAKGRPRFLKPTLARIDPLPPEVSTLIRSCPIHDPRPSAEARAFGYSAPAREARGARNPAALRAELGLARDERLVLLPIGSWAVELCRDLDIPYYEHLPRLLVGYLRGLPGRTRLLLLGGELGLGRETHGGLSVEWRARVPFGLMQDLTRAADLFLTDNVVSSSLGRAVLNGVPAAALVSSVEAGAGQPPRLEAHFELSPSVQALLTGIEQRAPGSVFPFAVFPMGLREEMQAVLRDNPYAATFEQLELFDETATRTALTRLLCDDAWRERLRARQAEYRAALERLPGAAEIATAALAGAQVQAWA